MDPLNQPVVLDQEFCCNCRSGGVPSPRRSKAAEHAAVRPSEDSASILKRNQFGILRKHEIKWVVLGAATGIVLTQCLFTAQLRNLAGAGAPRWLEVIGQDTGQHQHEPR